jgi:hypothetical protein
VKLALALLMAAAAGTCNPPVAHPPPGPIDIPDSGDSGAPVTDPPTQCEVAWAVMADAECAPAGGHDGWMAACVNYPQPTIDCVMTAESCSTMRNCQGFE